MKKVFFALIIITALACKNDKKETDKAIEPIEITKKEVLTSIKFPAYPGWGKVGIEITEIPEMFSNQKVYELARVSKTSKSSFAHTQNIPVNYASIYRASIIVKKGKASNLFGLRISGAYPDRVDAVFNLENGTVKGVVKGRDFENESANIEPLGNDWYKCSVTAEVAADEVKIIFGPTTRAMSVNGWEGKTNIDCNSYILPLSLALEEISFE